MCGAIVGSAGINSGCGTYAPHSAAVIYNTFNSACSGCHSAVELVREILDAEEQVAVAVMLEAAVATAVAATVSAAVEEENKCL